MIEKVKLFHDYLTEDLMEALPTAEAMGMSPKNAVHVIPILREETPVQSVEMEEKQTVPNNVDQLNLNLEEIKRYIPEADGIVGFDDLDGIEDLPEE